MGANNSTSNFGNLHLANFWGGAARTESGKEHRPLDAMIVGIIDTVSVDNRSLYSKKMADRF